MSGPHYLPNFTVRAWAERGDLLFCYSGFINAGRMSSWAPWWWHGGRQKTPTAQLSGTSFTRGRSSMWGWLDELSGEEIERGGVNPILHVVTHQVIENQIAGGEPEEVGQTVEELMRQDPSRHEAIHRVGAVLADEIYHILKDDRPFDAPGFADRLRRLVKQKGTPRRR